MSHLRTPGQSTTGNRRTAHLRFWLLVIIGSVWVQYVPLGPPGEPGRGGFPGFIRCPECGKPAKRRSNDTYKCAKGHAYKLLSNRTLERID
jgi:hypothetical protein